MPRKSIVYIGIGSIHSFRHLPGSWKVSPMGTIQYFQRLDPSLTDLTSFAPFLFSSWKQFCSETEETLY